MSMDRILAEIRSFDGVAELAPTPGSEFPELAWGDHFFYYAPDGRIPPREQPYATIVTKNSPGDTESDLDHPDRWRLNIHVGTTAFSESTGENPRAEAAPRDYTAIGVVLPHPVYRRQGWVSIVNPDAGPPVFGLLRQAHADAKRRAELRKPSGSEPPRP
ncbi:DUF6194 family protein [Nocardia stercoris]|uniref:DUF6194 domain-containing protein n=1 Tax=Nocardia stercoris TaxID=2483361 RepID=A0A3M2LG27_9NOCA|nr:DUF6194 family protein [Nocardia stercoris]RMI34885.1 hypothetical protein EBN03_00490 [Nocardia stercoris]